MVTHAKTKAQKRFTGKKRKIQKKSIGTCFVLMPFKEPFDTYFLSIIKPAVVAAKLEPMRGDSLFRSSPIMGDIWQLIQDCRVLVADLTEKNANVFYELGLAHAIGKPVVLIADNLGDVPFDLQSLRVLIYDKNNPSWGTQLKSSILEALQETLADTTSAVPSVFRRVVKSQAPTETKVNQRLDSLERQIASLTGRGEAFGFRLQSQEDLFRRLRMVASRSEAVEIARVALVSGLPVSTVSRVIRDAINVPSEAKAVLHELGLPI